MVKWESSKSSKNIKLTSNDTCDDSAYLDSMLFADNKELLVATIEAELVTDVNKSGHKKVCMN